MHRPVPTSRAPLPVLRAAVFAVVGTVLGMCAHHLAARGPVPWGQSALAAGALFGLGLVGTRRPRSLTTVVAWTTVAQAGLHLWLTLTTRHTAVTAVTAPHAHGAPAGDVLANGQQPPHDSAAMTLAHGLVAVLVALLLHGADTACWSLARGGLSAALDATRPRLRAVCVLLAGQSTVPVRPAVRVPVPEAAERPPRGGPVLAHAVVRRGPPPTGPVLVN
ncbi:hypothetical protein ACFS5L_10680 [Streptomyces phyllanthi]|uniref:Uncharacterized protein n=1 Tax=Streptomyces phyllanthi TaxID=1803180 RepID=A0A5N8W4Y8_9ACTN|nr:hypothetical protein [Streptomyces phyllanthi]MPY41408.1 hypothetical protein [Streptomyces phyllanthi]